MIVSQVTSVNKVTGYGIDDQGSVPGRGTDFSVHCHDQSGPWGTPSFLSSGYSG